MANNWDINTDDYDIYSQGGETPEARPGAATVDANGHLVFEPAFFPMSTTPRSTMDPDPNNTGPTNDFWTDYPITIDINGYIFYRGENTGINVRGPAGLTSIRWEDLTPEQKAEMKGTDGVNGQDGQDGADGADGADGLSAYEVWLEENGWLDDPEDHPISDFYQMIADLSDDLVGEGTGTGSIIINYRKQYNTASGTGAFACGYYTSARGNNSFTAGSNTIAGYPTQFAIGYFNENQINNIFEIGNGHNTSDRSNAFYVTTSGDAHAAGDIIDGDGNTLSNKVDKIVGKSLSTNDFTNNYKSFLDNYSVDTVISSSSQRPVANATIYNALAQISEATGKPEQTLTISDETYYFFHPSDPTDENVEEVLYDTFLQVNPYKKVFKTSNVTTGDNTYIAGYGLNLESAGDYQFIFGKYNDPISTDIIQIGWGEDNARSNILSLSKSGVLYVEDDVLTNTGHRLSNKQDTLVFDTVPTAYSTNIVNSGDLYTYLTERGLNPSGGFSDPRVTQLQAQVAALTTRVTALETALAQFGNPLEVADDTYPANIYKMGVDRDEFYIKLKENEGE